MQNHISSVVQVLSNFDSALGTVDVQYSTKTQNVTTWLSAVHLLLGLCCFVSQAFTISFNDKFSTEFSHYGLYYYVVNDVDSAGSRVWIGLYIIVTAAVGLAASRQNRKSLIITHQVLNGIAIILSMVLIGTSAAPINQINYCRKSGIYVQFQDSWSSEKKLSNLVVFGELLRVDYDTGFSGGYYGNIRNRFYCKHAMFRAWKACSCILLISSLMVFIISITLTVFDCMAACHRCCSRCSSWCVGSCCKLSHNQTPISRNAFQRLPFVPVQDFVNGPQVAYPVYAYPAAQSTSQTSAPMKSLNALYDQASTGSHATSQRSCQPAEVKSSVPPEYTE